MKTLIWIIIIIILIAGGFWLMNKPADETPVSEEDGQGQEMSQPIVVNLTTQNDSGISGIATLTDMEGGTSVELSLTGSSVDMAEPAHIHTGTCVDIGGVVYPLESAVNGVSKTTLNVPLSTILSELPLALNVHKSAEEVDMYVACGDLILNQ